MLGRIRETFEWKIMQEGDKRMKELKLNEASILSVLDPLRKKQVSWQIFISLTLVLDMVIMKVWGDFRIIGFFVLLIIILFARYQYTIARKQYVNTYKRLLAEKVLEACFDHAQYYPEQGFSREEFAQAGVFSLVGHKFSYHSEDLIIGTQDDIGFRQSDVRVTHRTGGKNRSTVVDVNGRLTRFRYDKDIRGRILITSKSFSPVAASLNLYSFRTEEPALQLLKKGLGVSFQTVAMEDVEFNQRFTVYATDAHSVYYLLTPPVMEYLKQLCSMNQKLSISFDGTFLYILRTGKGGIFEPPNKKDWSISEEVNKSYQELQEIVRCIETMRLDDRQKQEKNIPTGGLQENDGEFDGIGWGEPYWTRKI